MKPQFLILAVLPIFKWKPKTFQKKDSGGTVIQNHGQCFDTLVFEQ